jgi:hypothetical protein
MRVIKTAAPKNDSNRNVSECNIDTKAYSILQLSRNVSRNSLNDKLSLLRALRSLGEGLGVRTRARSSGRSPSLVKAGSTLVLAVGKIESGMQEVGLRCVLSIC